MKPLTDVNLDWLRVFHHVASAGSMTAAARALFITQPAVSHAVASLEDELGCRLFERANRRLYLTDEGRSVFQTTQALRAAMKAGDKALQEIRAQKTGLLRIGCPFLLLQTGLTPLLAAFHKAHPLVRIQVEIENRMQPMLDLVKERKVDLLFLASPEQGSFDAELTLEQIGSYRYAFFASIEHFPFLKGKALTLKEINAHPVVILRAGNNTRDYLERCFVEAGLKLNVQWETTTMAITEEFTKAGFGIGAMLVSNNPVVPQHLEGLFELETKTPLPQGHYFVVHRSEASLSDPSRLFLQTARNRLQAAAREHSGQKSRLQASRRAGAKSKMTRARS